MCTTLLGAAFAISRLIILSHRLQWRRRTVADLYYQMFWYGFVFRDCIMAASFDMLITMGLRIYLSINRFVKCFVALEAMLTWMNENFNCLIIFLVGFFVYGLTRNLPH